MAQRNLARPAIPTSRHRSGLRSTGAHSNRPWPNSTQKTSLMGEDCPHLYVVHPTINFWCGIKPNNLPRHTLGPTLPSQASAWSPEDVIQALSLTLKSQPSVWPSGDVHRLPRHHVTQRCFPKLFRPSALIPLCKKLALQRWRAAS
jgi:hypothetical protein